MTDLREEMANDPVLMAGIGSAMALAVEEMNKRRAAEQLASEQAVKEPRVTLKKKTLATTNR